MPLDRPCPACHRKFAHLTGCPVEQAHRDLDGLIASYGYKNIVYKLPTEPVDAEEGNHWKEKPC